MSISLREITQDNFFACMRLSVRTDQPFVASNAFSVAESKIFHHWITNAIYHDEEMVGFMMYAKDYEENDLYLCRFMIDQKYQGKGYGKTALDTLKEIALNDENINSLPYIRENRTRIPYGDDVTLILWIFADLSFKKSYLLKISWSGKRIRPAKFELFG